MRSDQSCDKCGAVVVRTVNYKAVGGPMQRVVFFAGGIGTAPTAEMDVCAECSADVRALFPHAPKGE